MLLSSSSVASPSRLNYALVSDIIPTHSLSSRKIQNISWFVDSNIIPCYSFPSLLKMAHQPPRKNPALHCSASLHSTETLPRFVFNLLHLLDYIFYLGCVYNVFSSPDLFLKHGNGMDFD